MGESVNFSGHPAARKMEQFCPLNFYLFVSVILVGTLLSPANGHGQIFDPPNRSSLWRFPEFEKYETEPDYDDIEHYCGGISVQHNQNGGKCGVCGDPWNQARPRDLEDGGKFASGVIVRNYTAGQVVPIKIYMDKAHWGYFELRLCERNSLLTPLTQECLDKNLLKFASRQGGTKYYVNNDNSQYYINTGVHFPKSLKCTKCVLQWHYRVANTWGDCGNGTQTVGCGPQETFRGCADVAIA